MFLLGLTGGIATGKSTVSRQLSELGCPVIDADVIAREVVQPGKPAWKKIKAHFGNDVLQEDRTLNRARLGQIIFNDEAERKVLNSITHPEIYKAMTWKALGYMLRGHQFVVMDLPLLFESKKMMPYMSYIAVVTCSSENQIARLMERNNLTQQDALQRINAQMSLEEKCRLATHIIDNNGTIEQTRRQVELLVQELKCSKRQWKIRLGILAIFVVLCSSVSSLLGIGPWFITRVPFLAYITGNIFDIYSMVREALPF